MVIDWKLGEVLEFHLAFKLYMHKEEAILDNEMHKDFEIHMGYQIRA